MIDRRAVAACLLVVAYVVLALAFTYPLVWHFDTHHVGEAGGDAKVYLWNYWWVNKALFELGTSPFQTDFIFHPIGIGLSLHTLAAAQGVVVAPLSAIAGSTVGANLMIVWTFVGSALATYALARRLGAGVDGSFLAGLVYGFCPYRLARLAGHYDLLGTEWIPLYVLLLFELKDRPRLAGGIGVAAGIVAAVCGYTALSYLVFLALFTLVFNAYHRSEITRLAPRLAIVAGVVVLLLAPLLFQMRRDLTEWTYPPYPGASRYGADLAAYVVPPPSTSLLPGRTFAHNVTEATVFPGYVLLLLATMGWKRHRFWLVTAVVFFVFSLGSSLHIMGRDTGIPLPFWLISQIPLLDNLRAPSRFVIVTMLALAMMMALTWRPRSGQRYRSALVTALIIAEYLAVPTPLFVSRMPDVYAHVSQETGGGTLVEIPGIEQLPAEVMDHQRFHGKPVFVGTAARVPVEKSEYWLGLPLVRPLIDLRKGRLELTAELIERERDPAPEVARFLDLGSFVIDKAYAKRGVVRFVREVLPVDTAYEDDDFILLEVRRAELPRDPREISAAGAASRQYFESGWMRPETEASIGFRWAHRRRSTLLFRRPEPTSVIELSLAPLDGGAARVSAELDGRALGTLELASGWQHARWQLPPSRGGVERLTLLWSGLGQASERDPRQLAARVRSFRFLEPGVSER